MTDSGSQWTSNWQALGHEQYQTPLMDSTIRRKAVPVSHIPVTQTQSHSNNHFWRTSVDWSTLALLFDVLLAATPCLFLILAFEALSADKSVSPHRGSRVHEAARVSPTVFPIIFATTIGRLMKTWAMWKAERGARLGTLEQMVGSQNLTSAIERAILLSGVGFWSILIVLLWLLSPLGGQASTRVNNERPISTLNTTTVYYFNNTGDGINGAFVGSGISSMKETSLNSLLHATLLSVRQDIRHDLWGNVRIPRWNYVMTHAHSVDQGGWYDLNQDDSIQYSAMTGIVVSGLKNNVSTNFTMQSTELDVTCSEPHFFLMNISVNGTARYGGFAEWAGPLLVHNNMSQDIFLNMVGDEAEWNSYLFDTNWGTNQTNSHPSFNLIYASQGAKQVEIGAYDCSVSMRHLESETLCKGMDCQVQRVRLRNSSSMSQDDVPFAKLGSPVPANMLRWLSSATWMSDWYIVSPIDWYISGSMSPFPRVDMTEYSSRELTYRDVSTDMVSTRLSSLINTVYQSSYQLSATSQPASQNVTALSLGLNASTAAQGLGYTTISVTATTILTQSLFVASIPWIVITIIVAFIMLFCGIATLLFKYTSHGPDILGYVSSMTRDNPNFHQSRVRGGGSLDGLQLAQQLKHLKVQIVNESPEDMEGHFTFREMGYAVETPISTTDEKDYKRKQSFLSTVSKPTSSRFFGGYRWAGEVRGPHV